MYTERITAQTVSHLGIPNTHSHTLKNCMVLSLAWRWLYKSKHVAVTYGINVLVPELFFLLILAHPVYKIRITQEANKLELWNKLQFEEEKTESIYHV
jgi:hypothetical protein